MSKEILAGGVFWKGDGGVFGSRHLPGGVLGGSSDGGCILTSPLIWLVAESR